MLVDKVSDYRTQFSKWWISEYKNVQFPEKVDSPAQHESLCFLACTIIKMVT